MARVRGVMAPSKAWRSSTQAPSRTVSDTRLTCAPRITGCAVTLGHTGTTATTSSPGSRISWAAIISALTPEDVTAMRSTSTGRCRSLV